MISLSSNEVSVVVLSKSIARDFVVPDVVKVNADKFPKVKISCFVSISVLINTPDEYYKFAPDKFT